MSGASRAMAGFLAGAALAAAAVGVAAKTRAPVVQAAPVEPAPKPEDPKLLEGLRAQIHEAEGRLAIEDAIAEGASVPGGRAAAAAAALAEALKGKGGPEAAGKAAKLVAHLLNRLRFEHQLADEELLIAPLRDRMLPDLLAAMGFAMSDDQRKQFDALLAFEEQAWKDRLEARGAETPLQRIAAALELAEREDDRLQAMLTAQQMSTLLAQPLGKRPADNVCMIGRRWVPPGRPFDPRAEKAKETLYSLWGAETGIAGVRFENFAEDYATKLRDLGPEPVDTSGGASIIWRRRQSAMQAQIQKAMLADPEFTDEDRGRIRKWVTADVWQEK